MDRAVNTFYRPNKLVLVEGDMRCDGVGADIMIDDVTPENQFYRKYIGRVWIMFFLLLFTNCLLKVPLVS